MEIRVIDEKSGNPFRYFDNEEYNLGFPRSYEDIGNVKAVMSGLLEQLGLQRDIHCLEIGAGHNPNPSQSLSQLGASVITLDADWESERHSDIPYERLIKLKKEFGKDLVIPRLGGRNGDVKCYMGDVAFLREPRSPLKNKEFEFVYFWGSMDYNGICSSVEDSSAPRNYGVEIKHEDRILRPIPAVKKDGKIISVAGHFCGHKYENVKSIGYHNMNLAELGLYWALASGRDPKVLGFFTQSPQSIIERKGIELDGDTEEVLCKNLLERSVQTKYYSRFDKDEYYAKLKEAQDRLDTPNRQRLENLGMIDAVFVGY
ncbi:MAG: hypothetical protein AABW92_05220 [Nanoarchaeota archaeon]